MTGSETFLWHDYETWGANPAHDWPAQFAALRTDENLTIIGEPVNWFCRPPLDRLPDPEACLITGITPQHAMEHGLPEVEFVRRIQQEMLRPGTCSVGYNTLRFDDEVTRFALFRNFHDPYEREWRNGNSRWDILDVVRLCAAVRPEGIQWPKGEDGFPSYKLEALAKANAIEQLGAHDALVDVKATLGLARMVKGKQPRLFGYALGMRHKDQARHALGIDLPPAERQPVLHVSGMFGSKNYCTSLVLPLCWHPTNKNSVVCFDLRHDPADFLRLPLDELHFRVFASKEMLGDKARVPLKNVHLNKSPMVAPAKVLDELQSARIGLDMAQARHFASVLLGHANLWEKAAQVYSYSVPASEASLDVDASLYAGGFFSDHDRRLMQKVVTASPEALATMKPGFQDARLVEMLFRYRARNFPESLNAGEMQQWRQHCQRQLLDANEQGEIPLQVYQEKLEGLYELHMDDDRAMPILESLMAWSEALAEICG